MGGTWDHTRKEAAVTAKRPSRGARGGYDRAVRFYDLLLFPLEVLVMRRHRQALADRIRGHRRILEVGIGTGLNLPHYLALTTRTRGAANGRERSSAAHRAPAWDEFAAIDVNPRMLDAARANAQQLGLDRHIKMQEMDVEDMGFSDGYFDCVVATCVFCTVRDPVRGFSEIHRVLRPGGEVILLEHVRSKGAILGPAMDALNTLSKRLVGEHINRDPVPAARAAGLEICLQRDLALDILREIVAVKPI